MKGWVYFARLGTEGPIKIGRACDPQQRVAGLSLSEWIRAKANMTIVEEGLGL